MSPTVPIRYEFIDHMQAYLSGWVSLVAPTIDGLTWIHSAVLQPSLVGIQFALNCEHPESHTGHGLKQSMASGLWLKNRKTKRLAASGCWPLFPVVISRSSCFTSETLAAPIFFARQPFLLNRKLTSQAICCGVLLIGTDLVDGEKAKNWHTCARAFWKVS